MMNLDFTKPSGDGKILHFDVECRPLSWYAGDWVTKEVTAIAAQFVGGKKMYCWLLGQHSPEQMAEEFVALYDKADMVSGHFVRGFDLPVINGMLFDLKMPFLSDKLSSDTKNDLIKFQGLSK